MVDLLTSDDVDKIVAEIHRRFPETSSDNFDADTPAERLSLARETLAKSTFDYHNWIIIIYDQTTNKSQIFMHLRELLNMHRVRVICGSCTYT